MLERKSATVGKEKGSCFTSKAEGTRSRERGEGKIKEEGRKNPYFKDFPILIAKSPISHSPSIAAAYQEAAAKIKRKPLLQNIVSLRLTLIKFHLQTSCAAEKSSCGCCTRQGSDNFEAKKTLVVPRH